MEKQTGNFWRSHTIDPETFQALRNNSPYWLTTTITLPARADANDGQILSNIPALPPIEKDLVIVGASSDFFTLDNFAASAVKFRIDSNDTDYKWSNEYVPIWSFAGNPKQVSYLRWQHPIAYKQHTVLTPKVQIVFKQFVPVAPLTFEIVFHAIQRRRGA